jgi:elongation factor P
MLDFSQIKLGSVVQFNNTPCVIIKCEFLRMQQRKPVKKCIMKNLISGNNIEYSFKSGEGVEEADLKRSLASFMYRDGDTLNFMLSDTYETIELPVTILGDKADYLKEGLEVSIVYFNDTPIAVDLPVKITYTISQTAPVSKGNTVGDVMKDAVLENGKVVKVPAFIKEGEKVIINTVEDEYVGRDTEKQA